MIIASDSIGFAADIYPKWTKCISGNTKFTERNVAMIFESDIPKPVRFSPFKHHRNFMLEILQTSSSEEILNWLQPVRHNCIDIYTGNMTPKAIGKSVIDILKPKGVFEPEYYDQWLAKNKGYRKIKLEDGSDWILRKSNDAERYIHLHPARTGVFCCRFKGSTLKTVFLLKSGMPNSPELLSLENVNQIRIQVGLSPVKKLGKGKGILSCYEKFFEKK